jgi:tetratricopeptide (TPR) repeat protein/tRNA A-37 threonylcarbamoyl transferase component Bud32
MVHRHDPEDTHRQSKSPPDPRLTATHDSRNPDPRHTETVASQSLNLPSLQARPMPEKLGRFVLLAELGEGAFGKVYRAQDPILNREVALKVAKSERLATPEMVERFRREARSASQLQHPNIVAVFDSAEDNGRWFIASTFVRGRSLDRVLKSLPTGQRMPIRDVVNIVRKVAEALAYAHKSGVIHRDIKPANVMLREDGEPMVMDFGLAARADESRITQDGQVLGSPAYMAPEQWQSQAEAASDQYSLGIMHFEMLTGELPFRGDLMSLAFQHAEKAVPSPRSFRKEIPLDLETICLKMLEKEPARRYADCQLLADDLRRWLEGELVSARRPGIVERTVKWVRRNPMIASLATAVALVLVLGATISTIFAVMANTEAQRANEAEFQAREQLKETEKARDQAKQRFELASKAFNEMIFGIQTKLEASPATQKLRRELLQKAREGLLELLTQSQGQDQPDRALLYSHMRMGDVERNLGGLQAANREYLIALEQAKILCDTAANQAEAQRDLALVLERLGDMAKEQGQNKEAEDYYTQTLGIFQSLAQAAPKDRKARQDVAICELRMGDLLLSQGKRKPAAARYRSALAIWQELTAEDTKDADALSKFAAVSQRMGDVMSRLGQQAEALAHYQKGMAIYKELHQRDRTNQGILCDIAILSSYLAKLQESNGELEEACKLYEDATDIFKRLAQADPDNYEKTHTLGKFLGQQGELKRKLGKKDEALERFKAALTVRQMLARRTPTNPVLQAELAANHVDLARLLPANEALEHFNKASEILTQVTLTDENSLAQARSLSATYQEMASEFRKHKKTEEATELYRKKLKIDQRILEANPKSIANRVAVGVTAQVLGDLLFQQGNRKEALEIYQTSLNANKAVFDANTKSPQFQMNLMVSYVKLGTYDQSQFTFDSAIEWYEKALKVANDSGRKQELAPLITDLQRRINGCRVSKNAVADEEMLFKQPATLIPALMRVRVPALLKAKKADEAKKSLTRFVEWIEKEPKNQGSNSYIAARLYALCAVSEGGDMEKMLEECVNCLRKAKDRGYFSKETIEAFNKEQEFEAIRKKEAFQKFLESLREMRKGGD